MLWVRISIRARCTTSCDEDCRWFATGLWFSPGPPFPLTNKTDRHDIAEILLKVALNIIKQTIYQNCPRPEYSWNTARWTLRNNESSGVAEKSFTASTMLIRFLSYLLQFDIKKRRSFTCTWRRMAYMTQYPFKVSGLALQKNCLFTWQIFCLQ
jgi:hypothetical protein